jgi:hypothetical protein
MSLVVSARVLRRARLLVMMVLRLLVPYTQKVAAMLKLLRLGIFLVVTMVPGVVVSSRAHAYSLLPMPRRTSALLAVEIEDGLGHNQLALALEKRLRSLGNDRGVAGNLELLGELAEPGTVEEVLE